MNTESRSQGDWGKPGERPGAPRAADELAREQGQRRPSASTTARAVQSWVDQQIDQAQRQGKFDNLPGAGKPLRDVDTDSDPDWWVKGLIERERLDMSDAMPGPLQLRREKSTYPESLLELRDEAAVRAHLEDFNDRVLADRKRPHFGPHSPPVVGFVDVDDMVGQWREAKAAADAQAEAENQARGDAEAAAAQSTPPRRRWWAPWR